jgi:ribosomal 50S subunit-associated protein YjgA (DUF615 family)
MYSNFLLGSLRITDGAQIHLKRIPYDLIARHAINEHGQITKREARSNEIAMQTIGEIVSRYRIDPTDASLGNVIIVTHATWDETLIKLETE